LLGNSIKFGKILCHGAACQLPATPPWRRRFARVAAKFKPPNGEKEPTEYPKSHKDLPLQQELERPLAAC